MEAKLRVTLPPDPNPRTPTFKPPAGTIDTHFHVFGPPHLFPYQEARRYTPPAAPVEHFFGMAKVVGIDRGVLVQPTVHRTDSASTLDAIAKSDGRLLGMIHAVQEFDDAEYRKLHAGGVRGVRFTCAPRLGGRFDVSRFERVVAAVAPYGWAIDLHLDPDFLAPHADMIRRVPLPVVIDHFANVHSTGGKDAADFKILHDLLGEKHVWLKISGADRLLSRGARYEDVVPLARAVIARAPDRIVWGTDWPHSNIFQHGQIPNDGDLMSMLADFAPDAADRRRILVDNPARLFNFS